MRYPVSYQYWKKRSEGRGSAIGFDTPYEEVTTEKVTFRKWFAEPVDRAEETSAWITARELALRALHKVLGRSFYSAHEGANTGGANGIYWVEIMGFRPGGLAIVANITEGARRKIPPPRPRSNSTSSTPCCAVATSAAGRPPRRRTF